MNEENEVKIVAALEANLEVQKEILAATKQILFYKELEVQVPREVRPG